MSKTIKTVWVYPPTRGPGGHTCNYMSFYEGDEREPKTPRGWGDTVREAEAALVKDARVVAGN